MADEYGRIASGVKRRNYLSRYREEMAAETRRRIVAAAIELFSERGCAATSIEDIAASAGVSGPTVFAAVGNKRELMKQARDVALVGDDKPVPMPQRPWVAALRAEAAPDAALRIYAAAMRRIFHRAARLELALAAAEADPELAGLAETAREQRAFGCRLIAKELASKSKLRHGHTKSSTADILFVMASPEVYRLLVLYRGWPESRYEHWLAQTLMAQLFHDD